MRDLKSFKVSVITFRYLHPPSRLVRVNIWSRSTSSLFPIRSTSSESLTGYTATWSPASYLQNQTKHSQQCQIFSATKTWFIDAKKFFLKSPHKYCSGKESTNLQSCLHINQYMNIKHDKIWRKMNGLSINKIDTCTFNTVHHDEIFNTGYYLIFDPVMSNSICIHDLSPPLCSSLFTFTGAKKGFLASKGLKTNYQKNQYDIEFVEHSISCHRNSRTKLTVSGFQMILVWLFLPCSISLLTVHRVPWGYTGECWNQQNVSCREKVLLTCIYKSSIGEQVQIPDLVSSRFHSKVLANSWPELFSPSYKVFLYAVNKIHLVNVWLRRQSLDILNHWPDTCK